MAVNGHRKRRLTAQVPPDLPRHTSGFYLSVLPPNIRERTTTHQEHVLQSIYYSTLDKNAAFCKQNRMAQNSAISHTQSKVLMAKAPKLFFRSRQHLNKTHIHFKKFDLTRFQIKKFQNLMEHESYTRDRSQQLRSTVQGEVMNASTFNTMSIYINTFFKIKLPSIADVGAAVLWYGAATLTKEHLKWKRDREEAKEKEKREREQAQSSIHDEIDIYSEQVFRKSPLKDMSISSSASESDSDYDDFILCVAIRRPRGLPPFISDAATRFKRLLEPWAWQLSKKAKPNPKLRDREEAKEKEKREREQAQSSTHDEIDIYSEEVVFCKSPLKDMSISSRASESDSDYDDFILCVATVEHIK
ncbi:hypothetical protein RND71_005359 [Anisodus tanguticus]|uniref:Uncharacterized protein n=1 Tax=Anisodus tanguticus TaxID=243964 RepID=A0AAE1SRD2_9SOLA|nr:hypothetical protein RND71_005359 [Anisodus tanguticus]